MHRLVKDLVEVLADVLSPATRRRQRAVVAEVIGQAVPGVGADRLLAELLVGQCRASGGHDDQSLWVLRDGARPEDGARSEEKGAAPA